MDAALTPLCPITGAPALRRIQRLSPAFLTGLWRWTVGVDVTRLMAGIDRISLWESPCGLAFFDPMIAGDAAFYDDVYRRTKARVPADAASDARHEFVAASAHVAPGAMVLDVGCGSGGFGRHLPHAEYCGIDPHVSPAEAGPGVRREPAEEHIAAHRGHYDVVSAFQVIEHVADPGGFARLMLEALRPGGLLIVGVPLWPSPLTDIPNLVINGPPYHLTWWNEGALRALCTTHGLAVVEITRPKSWSRQGLLQWMRRCSPLKARGPFFRNRAGWYASLAVAYALGSLCHRVMGPPREAEPIDVLLVARKA